MIGIDDADVDGTGRDGTGRDGTGRDGTGRDGTGRDGTASICPAARELAHVLTADRAAVHGVT